MSVVKFPGNTKPAPYPIKFPACPVVILPVVRIERGDSAARMRRSQRTIARVTEAQRVSHSNTVPT